jgi:glycosyltransferase involved in cell wall biosynthesis
VGSAVSAIPEVVADGVSGLLVPPRDPAALAEALAALLADPDLRAVMGAAGRARLEAEFSPARMISATAALYDRLGKSNVEF